MSSRDDAVALTTPAAFPMWKRTLLVVIAGALLPLAFAPLNFYLLAVISPALFFLALLNTTPRQAAWLGGSFAAGFFGVGVSWVFVAIYVFGMTAFAVSVVLTIVAILVLALFMALQGYLAVWYLHRLRLQSSLLPSLLALALFWVLQEWFRGWFLTGFPWLSLGYSQTGSVLAGYAPLLGVFGVSLLVVISAVLALLSVLYRHGQQRKNMWRSLALLLLLWIGGAGLLQLEWTHPTAQQRKVTLVQGNLDQMRKWDPAQFEKRKQTYLGLSEQHWDSDLILWPENSLTIYYHQLKNNFLADVTAKAKQHNTDIILGLPVLNLKTDQYYSALMVAGEPPQFYFKSHLVPFGEYVPLASVLRGMIAFFDLPMSGFSAGSADQPLFTAAGEKIAPTICYEDAFGEDVIRFLPEATLIMNASNNAWYGDSFAPHQHLQISQMRALETGRDVMRVTTNGISALIDHNGRIMARSPQFKTHALTGQVQPRTGATPYVLWGNLPVLLLLFAGLTGMALHTRRAYS